jgi:O-antigen/teichoic acid export membrane protein
MSGFVPMGLFGAGLGIAALRAANALLGFAVLLVLGRTLGPEGLGIYSYCVSLMALALVPIGRGYATLLLRESAAALHHQAWGRTRGLAHRAGQVSLGLAAVAACAGLAIAGIWPGTVAAFGSIAALVALAAIFLFDQLSSLRMALLRGIARPILGQVPDMLVKPVVLLAILGLALWLGPGAFGPTFALIALAIASAVTFVVGGSVLILTAPAGLRRERAVFEDRVWLKSAVIFASSAAVMTANSQADLLLLGALTGAADVGIYRVAVQVALMGGLVYTSLNMLAGQRFAQLRAAKDTKAIQATAVLLARLAVLCAVPLPLVLSVGGNWLITQVFGADFSPALVPMIILSLAQVMNAAVGMASSLLMMSGLEVRVMRWGAIALATNVSLCLILIPLFGINGAATANALAMGVWNVGMWMVAIRWLGIDTSFFGSAKGRGR